MPNPNDLPANDIPLTAAEQAAAAEFDETGAPKATADDAPPAADADAAAGASGETDPAAAGASVTTEPAPVVPDPGALPALHTEERDFGAEIEKVNATFSEKLQALKTAYSNNDLDDEEYEAQRDALIMQRADAREDIIAARTQYETRKQLSEDFAKHEWQRNVTHFLRQSENVVLLRSPQMQQVWQGCMQQAVDDAARAGKPLTTDIEIMAAGRDLLFQQLGLSAVTTATPQAPAATPAAGAEPAKPNRAPPLNGLPPMLGGIPGAAPSGAALTAESLANMSIEQIEQTMAGMTEAQQEALLRSVPGAFID